VSVDSDVRRIFGRVQLEREAYQYADSSNPVHVWRAYLAARTGGHEIPPWVLEYFEQSAQNLEPIFTRKYDKGQKVDPSEITDALGLTGQAGGGDGPVRQAQTQSRGLTMVQSWHALKKINAGEWTDARCTKQIADHFGVDDSTVRKALRKHRAET
jgi:hypothetical protein